MAERFPGIDWYCDRCNSYLNIQPGFDDHHSVWECTECGYRNSISADEIYDSEESFRNNFTLWNSDDDDEDDIPEGCRACGGPYPNCTTSCPLFDD